MRRWILRALIGAAVGGFLNPTLPAFADSPTVTGSQDPCAYAKKTSAPINISTAATTQLGPNPAAGQAVYVCSIVMTIAGSATTADTAQFIGGTGVNCGTPTGALTGAMGAGTATATVPVVVSIGDGGATVMATPAGSALCLTSAGTTVNIDGIATVVQTAN